jgi:hypothetical protein
MLWERLKLFQKYQRKREKTFLIFLCLFVQEERKYFREISSKRNSRILELGTYLQHMELNFLKHCFLLLPFP